MSLNAFIDDFIGDTAYVLQKIIQPHSFFDVITTATATVRIINLVNKDGVFNQFALLKLPMVDNIADNFWRSDNLVCEIDLATDNSAH